MSLDTLLQDEKTRLDKEALKLRGQINTAELRLQEIHIRLKHVEGLLGTNEMNESSIAESSSAMSRSLTDIAEEVLGERNGESMYYKDLAQEVQSRGGNIAGDNAAALLVSYLVKDDRFVRPVRKGFYALRRDYPNAKNVGARKRRRNSD